MPTKSAENRARQLKRLAEDEAGAAATPPPSSARKRGRTAAAVTPPASSARKKAAAGGGSARSTKKKAAPTPKPKKEVVEEDSAAEDLEVEEEEQEAAPAPAPASSPHKRKAVPKSKGDEASICCFVGAPVPAAEAKELWPERYQKKNNGGGRGSANNNSNGNDDDDMKAKQHYRQANVDNCIYSLNDDAYVKAGEGEDDYIGRIVEFFEGTDNELYFTAQWFFKAKDTVIKDHANIHDERRVFLSQEKNDNVLDCIVSKLKIVKVTPNINLAAKKKKIPPCDYYYDMSYSISYSTFANLPSGDATIESEGSSGISSDGSHSNHEELPSNKDTQLSLLDMYSGCGAMSTGLCLGANLSNINLVTRWAIDLNSHACQSLKLNHPQAQVRNEKADDFLSLIKEWEKLCKQFSLIGTENAFDEVDDTNLSDVEPEDSGVPSGEFEVDKLVGICYGDPHETGKVGVKFKVRWKGYGSDEDTWEPMDGLSKCRERIENFVREGYKKRILPLPGQADVICGGPPCQGISGFNRFRNYDAPLDDPKNQQMVVFMDIVDYLKPKYVLMENVVDILKFAKGFLGRYALSRLVAMNYQARIGILAAGSYGLPQFRMRCFLWGAQPSQKLPPFPLPTHDVVVRGGAPNEFEPNIVAYDENKHPNLEKALLLGDAISDLPPVKNDETRDEMPYGRAPKTEFQRFIRLRLNGARAPQNGGLYDHMPLQLNADDYERVCQIPKRKGANFRDLGGVLVGPDNVVQWDPSIPRAMLSSGKPLIPDYAMSFIKGKSLKPFARLWWDETVPTVVTRAEPHNQAILHPEQDRVLTIRENARLQGFPDYYQLRGPVKERYIQVGNAVAVPVSRALGYAFGLAYQGENKALITLPPNFPRIETEQVPLSVVDSNVTVVD